MLLRASAKANEEEIGMEGVMDDSEESQVPAGALLGEFTEAVVRRAPDLAAVRERVVEAMGPEAMVDAADARGLRLTLMWTAQWAQFAAEDPIRLAAVEAWSASGHDIALHHHSVHHPGTWDGYTDLAEVDYKAILGPVKADKTTYLGTLDDLVAAVKVLNPAVDSGCANDEKDKRVLPKAILYDTCPGFFTTSEEPVGTRSEGADPRMGTNDFVLTGQVDGVKRHWLNHGLVSLSFIDGSEAALAGMEGGAFGVIVHVKPLDLVSLVAWMDVLMDYDGGAGTSTVRDIIRDGGLPEQALAPSDVEAVWDD